MGSLTEAQVAFKQGNKQKAGQLLKVVIKENPSADAWYLAAKMTGNPDIAKQHLQRALAFDVKHVKARDLLRDLGGTPQSFSANMATGLWPSLRSELEKFGENKPVLKQLNPQQRMVTALGTFALIFTISIVLLGNVLTTPPAPELPPEASSNVFSSDALISHFSSSGINLASIEKVEPEANVPLVEQLKMTVQSGDKAYSATVYVYDDLLHLVNDRARLNELAKSNKITIYQTSVLVYPNTLDSETAAALDTTLNSMTVNMPNSDITG